MAKYYYIEFDTLDMKDRIVAVRVEVTKEVVRDMNKKMNINLADDPLYAALQRYVLANPRVYAKDMEDDK